MRTRLVGSCLVAILTAVASRAETPLGTAFTYQGQLKNSGSPASGSFNMVFQLFDALTLGNQIGPTLTFNGAGGNPPPVSVTDGLFTVPIDFGSAAFGGNKRWLSITVGGMTLTPRQELTAAPNALNADKLDGLNSTAFLQTIPVPLIVSGANSIAGIVQVTNTTGPAIQGFSSTNSSGLSGYTSGSTGYGVFGRATSTTGANRGGWFQSISTSGIGVEGAATAATGTTYGGFFESDSTSGIGVFGHAAAASGFAYGGRFESDSTNGRGVYGLATAASGMSFGGRFASTSTGGRGVYGAASALSGDTYGGYFESSSPDGTGVYGQGSTGVEGEGSAGVYGHSDSFGGRGVVGWTSYPGGETYGGRFVSESTSGRAVHGEATATSGVTYGARFENFSGDGVGVFVWCRATSGDNYGVYSDNDSPDGYAIYAAGDLGASGAKSFRIDHPDDPANKYLLHYCAESPEIINFYRGTVMLDGAGEAAVELPHYFAQINKTPSYQLTAVGMPMPTLYVAAKISEADLSAGARSEPGQAVPICSFRIGGGAPGGEVSWRVEAVRNDRWVQRRGAPVEVEKPNLEKGTYQHPELYSQPPEKGMKFKTKREPSSPPNVLNETPQ